MATDPSVSESVRLSAIKDALDRGGVSAKTAVEVEVGPPKPWEQILGGITEVVGGSRAEFRRSQRAFDGNDTDHKQPLANHPRELPAAEGEAIDAEILDSLHETAVDSTTRRAIRRRST